MRWPLLAAVLGLSALDAASFAQRPPGDESLTSSPSPTDIQLERSESGFFGPSGFAYFELKRGRLTLNTLRHRKGTQKKQTGDISENITVTATRGYPSVHYQLKTARRNVTVNVQCATHIHIESWLTLDEQQASLTVPPNGDIVMTLGKGENQETLSGATLLHIRMMKPKAFDRHWGCLLKHLMRGQSIRKLNEQTNRLLIQFDVEDLDVTVDAIHDQVQQLGSNRASARRAAEKQLTSWGTRVLPVIRSLDPRDLDLEQKTRLAKVSRKLETMHDDSARALSAMLVTDLDYWRYLAPSLDARQLARCDQILSTIGYPVLEHSPEIIRIAQP